GGIIVTIIGIIGGSQLFAVYLQTIANYTALYAGLAGMMVSIVYLYGFSALILFGAEFNAAYKELKEREITG
ncbi:MAG: YhjD/YihY/BrkB family envelope integrity protein, partial [Pseudomonadota bacterium]